MSCPRPGEECFEFMSGSSIDGICGGPIEPHEPTAQEFYDMLCNPITVQALASTQSRSTIYQRLEFQLKQLKGE